MDAPQLHDDDAAADTRDAGAPTDSRGEPLRDADAAAGAGPGETHGPAGLPDTDPQARGRQCQPDACGNTGATRCIDGQMSRCEPDPDGCGAWQDVGDCTQASTPASQSETDPAGTEQAEPGNPTQQPSSGGTAMDQWTLHTEVLSTVAGFYATPAPEQPELQVATDLGWTFAHRDRIWVLFGDSMRVDRPTTGTEPDDAIAYMSLGDFPDGASVEAFVREHPAREGTPAWRAAGPPLHYVLKPGTRAEFAPGLLQRDGMQLSSGTGFTPMGGFSNGRDDDRAAAFALFFRYAAVECDEGACSDGFVCDAGLGRETVEEWNPPCVVEQRRTCAAGPGYCQDTGSSLYDADTEMGRARSVVMRLEVGLFDEDDPAHFRTKPWQTNRFFNTALRTVKDFDPKRAGGVGNDYAPAQGNAPTRSGVFLWGRPNFGGVAALGTDAQLYLAWVPMPEVDDAGDFDWQPRFFAGLDDAGRPQFVEHEIDSVALDLDAATSGIQPQEVHDVLQQMSISWVPGLKRFVMFYGGDFGAQFLDGVYRSDVPYVEHDPKGSMFVRYAEHPWGPWTAPSTLLEGGDVSEQASATGLYAPGGIMAHNNCTEVSCARYEPMYLLASGNNNGVLYGANIVDPWTTERDGETDLYWHLSTWNPYQVLLMKTTLRHR